MTGWDVAVLLLVVVGVVLGVVGLVRPRRPRRGVQQWPLSGGHRRARGEIRVGIPINDQRPSGGCENCGGEVRTRKPGLGWVCAECAAELEQGDNRMSSDGVTLSASEVAQLRKFVAAVQPGASDGAVRSAAFALAGYLGEALDVAEARSRAPHPVLRSCPSCSSSNVADLGGYHECRECGHGF